MVHPRRASFSSPAPNMCVSFTVSVVQVIARRRPKPGMLMPSWVGSTPSNCWRPTNTSRRSRVPTLCRTSAVHVCWSTLASAAPTNRGVPSASEWLARGINGINRRTTGSVAAARWSSLSTTPFMSVPWRWRRPSYVAKKNVRPRTIGPPNVPPNWWRSNGCGSGVVNSKKLRASSAS